MAKKRMMYLFFGQHLWFMSGWWFFKIKRRDHLAPGNEDSENLGADLLKSVNVVERIQGKNYVSETRRKRN